MHVDEFIESHDADPYARWMLMHFRMPAEMQLSFKHFVAAHKLFCTYNGARYRCTGASRLGDVWLTRDFNRDVGYELRVDVALCSNWHPTSDPFELSPSEVHDEH